jgi:MoaA/NifB/PqqE/SkfB family radical SAM enzyme
MLSTKRLGLLGRMARESARALASTEHPILVHIIPMRRCNLSCGYCNEYDGVSQPVPFEVLKQRVDHLAGLGTSVITISGGEPLMHPQLDDVIRHIRGRGIITTLISNGYYMSPDWIGRLNRAGLDHLEISIDNVEPDEVSYKSLRLLEPKLKWLAEHAEFTVAINSVVGSGIRNPEDALAIARRARELGFMSSVGITHDHDGQLRALGDRELGIYREIRDMSGFLSRFNGRFQDKLALGEPHEWRCRAGARYLYVDEDGIVSYCSQTRGTPGLPLEKYTREDLKREFNRRKDCAPYCTVNCVQQVAYADNWRAPQTDEARFSPKRPPVTATEAS